MVTEDEMVGWYHQLNGHESEQTPGDSEGREARQLVMDREAWHAEVHEVTMSRK